VIEEIECDLRDMAEFHECGDPLEEKRKGRYHGSMFWAVKGFGNKRWVVGAYLDVDYIPYLEQGLGGDEIVQRCLNYLNRPPKRKKFQKKTEKPLYGSLESYSHRLGLNGHALANGNRFIEVLLITDQRKNKNFWGEGTKMDS